MSPASHMALTPFLEAGGPAPGCRFFPSESRSPLWHTSAFLHHHVDAALAPEMTRVGGMGTGLLWGQARVRPSSGLTPEGSLDWRYGG